MSDFSTYEITVNVAIRVSAYDRANALEVARGILLNVDGVMFVSDNKENN